MKHYILNFTLNSNCRGSNDYVKNYKLKIPNDKLFYEEPRFIGSIYNEKINFHPYLLDIELYPKSKINDLILDGGPISTKLIVSGKLKLILENYRKTGMQFFNINVLKKDNIYNDYWILNIYEKSFEAINFEKSEIYKTFNTFNLLEKLEINSLKEFLQIKNEIELLGYPNGIFIKKIEICNEIELDFYILTNIEGGVKYIVSENLKKEIEDASCTGIEFQPIELSLNEWLMPGGEREKKYGKY